MAAEDVTRCHAPFAVSHHARRGFYFRSIPESHLRSSAWLS
jgi:hypothetical protein